MEAKLSQLQWPREFSVTNIHSLNTADSSLTNTYKED